MIQWLKALVALLENLSLICSTHVVSSCQLWENGCHFLASVDTAWIWCTNIHIVAPAHAKQKFSQYFG